MLEFFIGCVHALNGNPWAPLIFVVSYTLGCLFLPVTFFNVAGGVLFGFWGGLAANMISIMAGALLAFVITRHWAQAPFRTWFEKRFYKYRFIVEKQAGFAVWLSIRLLGFPPYGILNYLAGLCTVSVSAYFWSTFFGVLPFVVLISFYSNLLWDVLETSGMVGFKQALAHHARPILYGALVLALILLLSHRLKKRLGQKQAGQ